MYILKKIQVYHFLVINFKLIKSETFETNKKFSTL